MFSVVIIFNWQERKNVCNLIQTLVFTVKSLCEGEGAVKFHEYSQYPFPHCDNFSFDINVSIPGVIIKSVGGV